MTCPGSALTITAGAPVFKHHISREPLPAGCTVYIINVWAFPLFPICFSREVIT